MKVKQNIFISSKEEVEHILLQYISAAWNILGLLIPVKYGLCVKFNMA